MLTVLTIDLAKGLAPVDSTAVMTDGRIVYASPTSLYVATERWASRPDPSTPTQAPSTVTTTIHKFDISDPTKTVYLGSGSVPGYLLNQWSLSEFQGVLRVVSTDTPAWWGSGPNSQSYLTTLRESSGSSSRSGRSAGSARASASTPCASSATTATSSRSIRSIRCTRSTSPTRRTRRCSAS